MKPLVPIDDEMVVHFSDNGVTLAPFADVHRWLALDRGQKPGDGSHSKLLRTLHN
jgi:hypothetical protein